MADGEATRPVMLTASEAQLILDAIDSHLERGEPDPGEGPLVLAMVTADKVRAVREALTAGWRG